MNSTTKIVIAIIAVVLIGGGLYWYAMQNGQLPGYPSAGTPVNDSTALPSGSNTSDASLNQDMSAINANIQASNADSAQVNDSVNAHASGY
jgi:hypothetical protein